MNTPTPRTDEFVTTWDFYNDPFEAIDHAQTLERDLTAAREELAELKEEYGTWWAQKRIAIDELAEVTEQRDRLLEERKQWRLSSVCRELVEQLNEAREKLKAVTEQRDKLAELSGFGEFDKPIFP